MSTAAPNRSGVLCSWMDQGWRGYSQHYCPSTPAGASKPPQERDAWCQLLAKWLKMSAIREQPVQCYSEVFGLGEEGQGFVGEVDYQLTQEDWSLQRKNVTVSHGIGERPWMWSSQTTLRRYKTTIRLDIRFGWRVRVRARTMMRQRSIKSYSWLNVSLKWKMVYTRDSQTGVHAPLVVHLPTEGVHSRLAIEGKNMFIYFSFRIIQFF